MTRKIRINKYLSQCGLGSRRKVEEYIISGRIRLNGVVEKSLNQLIDIENDSLKFDNKSISIIDDRHYILLNKPGGCITTRNDEMGRRTVMDLLPAKYRKAGIFPVGRLDKDTEGLLLLTNDGETAYRLTHPKFGVEKEYIVELDRPLKNEDKKSIESGVYIDGRKTSPAKIKFPGKPKNLLKMIIAEGKKRQIRISFKNLSYKILTLRRVALGPLKLGTLESGAFRIIKKSELENLKKYIHSLGT